jgi:hypothetical protein
MLKKTVFSYDERSKRVRKAKPSKNVRILDSSKVLALVSVLEWHCGKPLDY